jgi:ribose transport system substrate-binding protein
VIFFVPHSWKVEPDQQSIFYVRGRVSRRLTGSDPKGEIMRAYLRNATGLAILVASILSVSCQKSFHSPDERYVFVAANVKLPYWQDAKAGFMDAARTMGVKADFTGPDTYSPDDELAAFQKAVEQNPSGILVSPARPDKFTDAINEAIQKGIPVICMDSDSPESKRIMFIGTDNYHAGMESAARMAKAIHDEGNVVVITIPGQHNLDERMRGVEDAFKKLPKIKISETLDDKGAPESANDQISSLLEHKEKIDGILCLEASGGPGAAEVLHRLNLAGKIAIVAMDKNPETLDWIQQGVITATIAQKPYTMAFYGLRFLDDLHHNIVHEFKDWRTAPASPLPTDVDTGTAVIDSSNLAAFRAAEASRPATPAQ